MKKFLALSLALLLIFCAVPTLADVVAFESLGGTIDLPEGMQLLEYDQIAPEIVEATGAFAAILDEANNAYVLFTFTEDEEITYLDLAAMTPEELTDLANNVMAPNEVKEVGVLTISGDVLLGITFIDDAGVEQNIMVQFGEGGFVVVSFRMADNSLISDEVGAGLLAVVNSLVFTPAE